MTKIKHIKKTEEDLLADLGLEKLSQNDREKCERLLRERFEEVVLNTLIAFSSPEQRQEILEALKDSENMEARIEKVASEVENLDVEIEKALLKEFEAIKFMMGMK